LILIVDFIGLFIVNFPMKKNHPSAIPLTNRCENFLRHSHSSETSERNHIDFANY